jgi:hypothetical protein
MSTAVRLAGLRVLLEHTACPPRVRPRTASLRFQSTSAATASDPLQDSFQGWIGDSDGVHDEEHPLGPVDEHDIDVHGLHLDTSGTLSFSGRSHQAAQSNVHVSLANLLAELEPGAASRDDGNPTLADVVALKPRRLVIPRAARVRSPADYDSWRAEQYERATRIMCRAFKKNQLLTFCRDLRLGDGPDGTDGLGTGTNPRTGFTKVDLAERLMARVWNLPKPVPESVRERNMPILQDRELPMPERELFVFLGGEPFSMPPCSPCLQLLMVLQVRGARLVQLAKEHGIDFRIQGHPPVLNASGELKHLEAFSAAVDNQRKVRRDRRLSLRYPLKGLLFVTEFGDTSD